MDIYISTTLVNRFHLLSVLHYLSLQLQSTQDCELTAGVLCDVLLSLYQHAPLAQLTVHTGPWVQCRCAVWCTLSLYQHAPLAQLTVHTGPWVQCRCAVWCTLSLYQHAPLAQLTVHTGPWVQCRCAVWCTLSLYQHAPLAQLTVHTGPWVQCRCAVWCTQSASSIGSTYTSCSSDRTVSSLQVYCVVYSSITVFQ